MNIYVASSWRNNIQPDVVAALREAGFEVYDFKNPAPGDHGFSWRQIDPDWENWTSEKFADIVMNSPTAQDGFDKDMDALESCDICVLVMPCGRSAHIELGWAAGNGKATLILLSDGEPELMYRMVDGLVHSIKEVVSWCELHREENGNEP